MAQQKQKEVNRALLDAAIIHAILSLRYSRGLSLRIVDILNQFDDDLVGQVAARSAKLLDAGPTTARITAELPGLAVVNDRAYRAVEKELQSDLTALATYEADWQAQALTGALAGDVSVAAPTAAALAPIVERSPIDGYLLRSWIENMSANRLARLEKAMRIGLAQGQTVDQLVKVIRGTKAANYTDGILNVSRNSARTLAITASSTVGNAARVAVFQKNTNIISAVQWHSVLDERTSQYCQMHDGEVYDIDQPFPTPPAHPNCRSILIPILKGSTASTATRASVNGQVPATMKYGEWLKTQSASVQDQVLGKARGQMFRSGDVKKFGDLFRDNGTYKSLSELRAAEAKPAA